MGRGGSGQPIWWEIFTFSELYIVLYICEKDQLDAHFFLLIYFNYTILYMFQTNNSSNHMLAMRHHKHAWKYCMLRVQKWWTCFFKTHSGQYNWNKLRKKVRILLAFLTYWCKIFLLGVRSQTITEQLSLFWLCNDPKGLLYWNLTPQVFCLHIPSSCYQFLAQ